MHLIKADLQEYKITFDSHLIHHQITMYIIASSVSFFLMVIGFILFISPAYKDGWSSYAIWWIVFLALYLTSFFHVSAFVSPDVLQRSRSKERSTEVKDSIHLSVVASKSVESKVEETHDEEESSEESVTMDENKDLSP